MFRFSIRDLLWATLVVALALGWLLHYRAVEAKRQQAIIGAQKVVEHAKQVRNVLAIAQKQCEQLEEDVAFHRSHPPMTWRGSHVSVKYNINWKVLDEPLPPLE